MRQELLLNWNEIHRTTMDLLNSIPEESYHIKPFSPRFKSFSWEFSCILTTRLGYIRGIKSGILDGSCFVEKDSETEQLSKQEILKKLEQTYSDIKRIIKDKNLGKIDYFDTPSEIFPVIYWLLQHEQLHYGKLILYFSKADISLPKSLKMMWGENNFSKV